MWSLWQKLKGCHESQEKEEEGRVSGGLIKVRAVFPGAPLEVRVAPWLTIPTGGENQRPQRVAEGALFPLTPSFYSQLSFSSSVFLPKRGRETNLTGEPGRRPRTSRMSVGRTCQGKCCPAIGDSQVQFKGRWIRKPRHAHTTNILSEIPTFP